MPRIAAATNAQQRQLTQQRILSAFGDLLFTRGLPGLTITDVARHADIGRTAIYNYFPDIEQLLVAYVRQETDTFILNLHRQLSLHRNPIEQLATYVRAQLEHLSSRHLPPGPAMQSVLSPEAFSQLAGHVKKLDVLLQTILDQAIEQGYVRECNSHELSQIIHGLLASYTSRCGGKTPEADRVETVVSFILTGSGAHFSPEGRPIRPTSEPQFLATPITA